MCIFPLEGTHSSISERGKVKGGGLKEKKGHVPTLLGGGKTPEGRDLRVGEKNFARGWPEQDCGGRPRKMRSRSGEKWGSTEKI